MIGNEREGRGDGTIDLWHWYINARSCGGGRSARLANDQGGEGGPEERKKLGRRRCCIVAAACSIR